MTTDIKTIIVTATALGTEVGLKILGAIVLWIVGRWLIRVAGNLTSRALSRQRLDGLIIKYIHSSVSIVLTVILIVAIFGFFGVETVTFAALLGGAGVAIGVAWSGLLGNFAAGIFLVALRPFKIDDFVDAGGVTGTVENIGIFNTTIIAPDNVMTFVGNGKIIGDTILNYSAKPYRRVDLTVQIANGTDHRAATELLRARLKQVPNVLPEPAPDVEILQFGPAGPTLAVRPYCKQADYWQVYFDSNRLIRDCFIEAGYAIPEQHIVLRQAPGNGDHRAG